MEMFLPLLFNSIRGTRIKVLFPVALVLYYQCNNQYYRYQDGNDYDEDIFARQDHIHSQNLIIKIGDQ